jgi:hypothetical protein
MITRKFIGAFSLIAFICSATPGAVFAEQSKVAPPIKKAKSYKAPTNGNSQARKDKITTTCAPGTKDYDIDQCYKDIKDK